MNTCKSCKHWESVEIELLDEEFNCYILESGKCSSSKFIYMDGEGEDGSRCRYNQEQFDDSLQYVDLEKYQVHISVGPNFGCIHWATK